MWGCARRRRHHHDEKAARGIRRAFDVTDLYRWRLPNAGLNDLVDALRSSCEIERRQRVGPGRILTAQAIQQDPASTVIAQMSFARSLLRPGGGRPIFASNDAVSRVTESGTIDRDF
jgi:hypothetical protein